MVEWMLSNIICHEFEKVVGKSQHTGHRAFHIGFGVGCGNSTDQYRVVHMYVFAPGNYAYVAIQEEWVDEAGDSHLGNMEILSYHDSCWRDAIQNFIFKRRGDLNLFRSFGSMSDWYDIVTLDKEEMDYLDRAERWRRDHWKNNETFPDNNPFDKRRIWKT